MALLRALVDGARRNRSRIANASAALPRLRVVKDAKQEEQRMQDDVSRLVGIAGVASPRSSSCASTVAATACIRRLGDRGFGRAVGKGRITGSSES
jgi:hypothetical protein